MANRKHLMMRYTAFGRHHSGKHTNGTPRATIAGHISEARPQLVALGLRVSCLGEKAY
jgi:hypothetical protein